MIYYKVVTEERKSLGLRKNPTILTTPIGEWELCQTVGCKSIEKIFQKEI